MILIYIPCKDNTEAKSISGKLLEKKLVACTNLHPITSMYWWEGKITEDSEVVIIAKSKESRYEEIKKEVEKIHSYDVPCILKMHGECNEQYNQWINDVTQ